MKCIIASSEKIIVPEIEPLDQHLLKVYHHLFRMGIGDELPSMIVASKEVLNPYLPEKDSFNESLSHFLEENPKAEYFLIEGAYMGVASTFLGMKHHSLKIEDDSHIQACREMLEDNSLFTFSIKSTTIDGLSEEYAGRLYLQHSEGRGFMTLKDYTSSLVSRQVLPESITRLYSRRNR